MFEQSAIRGAGELLFTAKRPLGRRLTLFSSVGMNV
jgi:hypothetical protein